jgi:large subunit ribosomal protein L6
MSRIGMNPINFPDGVDVGLKGSTISVKGPKGALNWSLSPELKVSIKDKSLTVERSSDAKHIRALHGTTRSIIANMINGVSSGYQRKLSIIGVGYRAQVQGKKIIFTLGYSHPVQFDLPEGISAEVDKKQTLLTLEGIDKQLIGQVAANIRSLRKPDVYKGKGIRYEGEHIKLKAGKAGK